MSQIWFAFLFIILSGFNSEAAGLRCFDLFGQVNIEALTEAKSTTRADFYAAALDALNEKYNRFLFKNKVTDILNPQIDEDTSWLTATRARFRAYRLRKRLNQLHEFDGLFNLKSEADLYALEKLAVKLEKLTFLNDDSVTQWMNPIERGEYRQAQHALFAGGLAKFLFFNEDATAPSVNRQVLKAALIPFKDEYFRWSYAMAWMPKLDGSSIPFSVIEKVAIEGYDQNKDLLKPYLIKSRARASFNLFSKAYNAIIAATLAIHIGQMAHFTYYDVYIKGIDGAVAVLDPMKKDAEKIARVDYQQERFDRTLGQAVENFKESFQRDPSEAEMSILRQMVRNKTQPPSHS